MSKTLQERFDEKWTPEPNTGCWLWTASTTEHGYGVIGVGHKTYRATHLALGFDGRPRPDGLMALHSCDVPACVNPAHLRWGTAMENMSDMRARGRSVVAATNWEGKSIKLNAEAVRYVLSSPKKGIDLAAELGVHPGTISKVRVGRTWTHIQP